VCHPTGNVRLHVFKRSFERRSEHGMLLAKVTRMRSSSILRNMRFGSIVAVGLFLAACDGESILSADVDGSAAVPGAGGNSGNGGAGASGVGGAVGGNSAAGGAAGVSGSVGGAGGAAGAGAGGAAGAGGTTVGGTCPTGSVTLRMKPLSGQTWCASDAVYDSFTIRPLGGQPLNWVAPSIGVADGGAYYRPLGSEGQQMTWDGTYYLIKACDAGVYCLDERCAQPGKYVAAWRASPAAADGSCTGTATPVTHEVTFDWPATTTLSWVIGESPEGGPPDAACGGDPVWFATSTDFSLHVGGSMPNPSFGDGGCRFEDLTYEISTSTGMLSKRGCDWNGPFDQAFRVTASEMDTIAKTMGALWTTCPGSQCAADGYGRVLNVWEGTDALPPRVFTNDLSAGCPSSTSRPPYVSDSALGGLEASLNKIIAAHCPDAGVCTDGNRWPDASIDALGE
jgi:hypothetical protein